LFKNEEIPTYLNLSISLDPAIEVQNTNSELYYPGGETQSILDYCSHWLEDLMAH
jgi:hypothetical protein